MLWPRRLLLTSSGLYLATAAVGTALAIRKYLPARALGITWGTAPAADFVRGNGTGLSAPLYMLVLLALTTLGALRDDIWGSRALRFLTVQGAVFIAGQLSEPITWRALRKDEGDAPTAVVTLLNTALPAVIVVAARRELAQRG